MRKPFPPLKYTLLPLAWLYDGVTRVRNKLYDAGTFEAYEAPIPVICVGNLTVGGTGKTPMVEYLARLLSSYKVAILSRGYKRKTKGFVLADAAATALTLGDEPYQYVQSLPLAQVAVCEKRAEGIQRLLQLFPDLEVILLDDAFQHRAVKASHYLLLSDYGRLFTQDHLLPAGRLRESRAGAGRADAVIITKCPDRISIAEQKAIIGQVQQFSSAGTPVFFTRIAYAPAVPMGTGSPLSRNVVLVTGIANARPLVEHLRAEGYQLLRHFEWADHAELTPEKVQEVTGFLQGLQEEGVSLLMTQKDAVKWQQPAFRALWQHLPVFYLPISVAFTAQQHAFEALVQGWLPDKGFRINS